MVAAKALLFPVKQRVIFQKVYFMIIGYAVFLIFLGIMTGAGIYSFMKGIRYFTPLLLLPFIPRLIPYQTVTKIIVLMFISSFILLGCQLLDILTGKPVACYLGETLSEGGLGLAKFDVAVAVVRSFYGPFILLFSLIVAMALLVDGRHKFKNSFLYTVSLFAVLSIFLSATRGWILAAALILTGFAFLKSRKTMVYALLGVVVIFLILFTPKVNKQAVQAYERMRTLESIAQGDLRAGGPRLTERSPRVLRKYWEQPVFGFGFSDEFYEYSDVHVGNQTLLLNGGIVGYAIFALFILYFLRKYKRAYRNYKNKPVLIFFFGLLAVIAIHSTSRMVFGYYMDVSTGMSLALFFFFSDYFLSARAKDENYSY